MVGIVISSHSKNIAEGIKELVSQFAPNVPIAAAGGTEDGRVGTNVENIIHSIESVYSDDGVIIIFDMGSAYMNAEIAIGCLSPEKALKIKISDVPIVEGAVVAAVESSKNKKLEEILEALKPLNIRKVT
ncbi:MAG: dihydroxyacetone kinase phosphoryl donor subunit DhaM [Clostridiaceae bacterium]